MFIYIVSQTNKNNKGTKYLDWLGHRRSKWDKAHKFIRWETAKAFAEQHHGFVREYEYTEEFIEELRKTNTFEH